MITIDEKNVSIPYILAGTAIAGFHNMSGLAAILIAKPLF
jgi:hypothetical protein